MQRFRPRDGRDDDLEDSLQAVDVRLLEAVELWRDQVRLSIEAYS